jgi:predicted dehydrogenase
MNDDFFIAGLSDLSPGLLAALGKEYGVPPDRRFLDYHDLVQSDLDAVIVCPSSSHGAPTVAAAQAGKHVLVEKPMCTTVREAKEMVAAAEKAGVVLMVAYMKRHDPAYQYAKARVAEMADVRFVQVNHLHPDNSHHLAEFRVLRFDDIAAELRAAGAAESDRLVAEALGFDAIEQVPPAMRKAFPWVLGSMIHDIGNLHGLFGPPSQVLHAELWLDGNAITTTLAYEAGQRAVCTWVDLPDLWAFEETLEVYGSRDRVIVSFPTGFSMGLPSLVTLHGMDAGGTHWRKELSWHDNPFKLELRHFRDCMLSGALPLTDGRDAVHDIALVRDIVLAADRRG